MVTVYGDEETATQEQATPIRFDTSYEQPEKLSLDQYIDAAVERAIRKLDAPVATMIRSFNATPDRHENVIIATPQRLNDTAMGTPHQHDNMVVATPNRHVATVVATPEKINTDLDILTILKEEKKSENTPDMQIEKIVTQHLKSLMQIEGAHADRSSKNDEDVQNDEKRDFIFNPGLEGGGLPACKITWGSLMGVGSGSGGGWLVVSSLSQSESAKMPVRLWARGGGLDEGRGTPQSGSSGE
ncbi:hypothetical protein GE061_016207 [Apolygus lucorum]|uniref:Uncharacterized protein n=1 Tax=Apolygus lucorum TaxID=248454 RepID=A0A8S9XGP3_APOLU|nr:hypothetical protein GE061_016207 [Apolygus lucorum]